MFSHALCALWLLLLIPAAIRAAPVPTDCNQQLFNYYTAIGLNASYPIQPALQLTSGTLLGLNYSTAVLAFQQAARNYESQLNTSLASTTWVNFESIDIPWCTSLISLQCCARTVTPTFKTANCTTLIDYDPGGSANVAGRLFIYPNQTASCNGTPVVTFWNTSLVSIFDATYTYDATGIRNHGPPLSFTQARSVYRRSKCAYSDGAPADIVTQDQFVCIAQRMGCRGDRVGGAPTLPIIPVPSYACLGNVTPGGPKVMVWRVSSVQEPSGIDGVFGQACTSTLNTAEYFAAKSNAMASSYILEPSTRRQFVCTDPDFDQYLLLFYNNETTSFQPSYPFSIDPLIRVVPCICDFSMDCINGVVDTVSEVSALMLLSNAPPIPDPGPAVELTTLATTLVLNATASYDPDDLPQPLSVYWKLYETPYDPLPPPFVIPDPRAFVNVINTTTLQVGTYVFILYVSDSQQVTFTFFNITILPNQVTAVCENDKVVPFKLYGSNCTLNYPPLPCIILNGSLSWETNPSLPLTYQWTQIAGFSLQYLCDPSAFLATRSIVNLTDPVACFVPPFFGLYTFQLCVTDTLVTSCDGLQILVVPDFDQPAGTLTPIINFTDPPIRNLTQPTRPILNFTNITRPPLLPPVPVPPPPAPDNITVPPIFPYIPPASFSDQMALLFVLGAMLLLYFIIFVGWLLFRPQTYYRYLDRTSYGPY